MKKEPEQSTQTIIQKYAVAYLRVSTDQQTVENQRHEVRKFAEHKHYVVLDWFEDEGVSGKVPATERTGFKQMMEFLKTEKVDAVITYEISRIGRSMFETFKAIDMIQSICPLLSTSDTERLIQGTDPATQGLLHAIFSWMAEMERRKISERAKMFHSYAKSVGRHTGRPFKNVDEKQLKILLEAKTSKLKMARLLGISLPTLHRRIRELKKKQKAEELGAVYSKD